MKRTIRLEFEYEFDDEDWELYHEGVEDWSEDDVLTAYIGEIGWGDVVDDGENRRWSFGDAPETTE